MRRESAADVKFQLRIRRDGSLLQNDAGASDISDFIVTVNIIEGIHSAGIEAVIQIQDSANLIASLTGGETFEMTIEVSGSRAFYKLRAYSIENRTRQNNTEVYSIKLVSPEYLQNEVSNLFGHSSIIFDGSNRSNEIVDKILTGKQSGTSYFMQTQKKVYIEETTGRQNFVMSNWRWFDTIYWIAQRSIRKGTSNTPQNGFLFWENLMGYNFKSIDTMIKDVNDQKGDDTNFANGSARLYRYTYDVKKSGDEGSDNFKIESIQYPSDRNFLVGLRNGAWAGFSIAVDPTVFANSQIGGDFPTTSSAYVYTHADNWNDMNHIKPGKNPIESFTPQTKSLVTLPRRLKYNFLPNRIMDNDDSDTKVYSDLSYLQAYQYLRVESLKNVRLLVVVPGNLDLYSGKGVEIQIPETKPQGQRITSDRKYSGRYLIAGLRHKYDGRQLYTEMLLYRDTLPE